MNTAFLHKILFVIIVHRNSDLFSRQALCSYVNSWFELTIAFNNFLDIIDVFYFKREKSFFDFENILSITACHGSLSI